MSIFLKLPSSPAAAQSTDPLTAAGTADAPPSLDPTSARVTLSLHGQSVLEVLREVARQAGLKVKVERSAVSLVPLGEPTDPLVTAEFRLPPETLVKLFPEASADVSAAGATAAIVRIDARALLEKRGVAFLPGAVAVYLPQTGKLVVRVTQSSMDQIEALLPPPNDAAK